MLTEKHLENYADVLWWGLTTARRQRFRKGDLVQIRFHSGALRLAEILHRKLIEKGLQPIIRLARTADMESSFYHLAGRQQLAFIPPGEANLSQRLNGSIFLNAPESLTHLRTAAPESIAAAAVAAHPLRTLLETREIRGDYAWTLCMLPTDALAHHAGISLARYTRQVVNACFLEAASPVSEWQRIHRRAATIKRWLDRLPVAFFQVESASTDLVIPLGARRRWAGVSGRNIPSFELFVSPDWRGVRGVYGADQPSFRNGNRVRGVRLEFKDGRVVRSAATEGGRFLKKQLAMDAGACRVGEFSLTDRRFSKIDRFMANTLFDENYGGRFGNCHLALGSSYANTYAGDPKKLSPAAKDRLGFNQSALHWDFVNTEKKRVTAVLIDGTRKVVYENGEFLR
ncbi:MAG: aminopeptidase [Desulfobacterales bacterium]|jgi:aminopeptidase|nr:aminopeptidase [Desulfobacterales bacterium]